MEQKINLELEVRHAQLLKRKFKGSVDALCQAICEKNPPLWEDCARLGFPCKGCKLRTIHK